MTDQRVAALEVTTANFDSDKTLPTTLDAFVASAGRPLEVVLGPGTGGCLLALDCRKPSGSQRPLESGSGTRPERAGRSVRCPAKSTSTAADLSVELPQVRWS